MAARSRVSAQTRAVLAALSGDPRQWQHGYALAKRTDLKSGTLYPILIRLADRGLVEACWEAEPAPGRPRRHLYRLTADGVAAAAAALADAAPDAGGRPRPRATAAGRGVTTAGRGVTASVARWTA